MKFNKFFLLFLFIPFMFSCTENTGKVMPKAKEGVIDLRNWDFQNDGTIPLSGDWEFYWEQLVSPENFKNNNTNPPHYFTQPATWNSYKINGKKLGGKGYATYHLLVDIKKTEEFLALSIPSYYNSYKLWLNGELFAQNGEVGTSFETSKPQWLPITKVLKADGTQLDIIIQISNFHHTKGGVYQSIKLGTYKNLSQARELTVSADLMAFACLLLIGLFFFGMYLFWKNDKSLLYFALFCIVISYRFIGAGTYVIINIFPDMPWAIAAKAEYLSMYFPTILMLMFIAELFPKAIHQISVKILQFIILAISLLTLLFPISIYSLVLSSFQIIILIYLIYVGFVCIRAYFQKYDGAIFAIISILVLLVSIMITVLSYLSVIPHYSFVFQIGLLVFVFTQTLILSHRFAKAFHQVERLKEKSLEQKNNIEQQHEELSSTLSQLKGTQLQLVQSEKMASLGQLTAGIAHEINNPINFVYAGVSALKGSLEDLIALVKRYSELKPDKAEENNELFQEIELFKKEIDYEELSNDIYTMLSDIRMGANRTVEIVKGLRQFSRLDEADLKKADIHGGLDATLILLKSQLGNEIEVVKDYDSNLVPLFCFPGQLNQVFMNLLSNAIQAIGEKGTIWIDTAKIDNTIEIRIKDSGSGIDKKVMEHIFEPFFTTKEVGEGTGLGLSISYGIIEKHKGTIHVESKEGEGTAFIIRIPNRQSLITL